jgi:hypothetical protein
MRQRNKKKNAGADVASQSQQNRNNPLSKPV